MSDQPTPNPGNAPHSVDLVVIDLMERKRHGIAKYGVAHQSDNGRDHLRDAYEEAQDLSIYLRAEMDKQKAAAARVAELEAALAEIAAGRKAVDREHPLGDWCGMAGRFITIAQNALGWKAEK